MLYYRQVPNLSQTNLNEIYASQTASIERGGHPDMEFLQPVWWFWMSVVYRIGKTASHPVSPPNLASKFMGHMHVLAAPDGRGGKRLIEEEKQHKVQ